MAAYNLHQQYQQNSVMTASPEELTLMLYNGVIKFITLAKVMIEQKDIEKSNNAILRAQAIINELNITLDMKYEISNNLRQLYEFMLEKLLDANIKKNIKPLDEILPLLRDLRDTWKEAMRTAKIAQKRVAR